MAEMLVRVVDKIGADVYQDVQLTKRGDVITIQRDRWAWGSMEQKHPHYRIVRVLGVSVADLASLIAPEPETDPANPSATLQRRAFKLDLDSPVLADAFAGWLDDDARAVPMRRFDITLQQLLDLRIQKPPVSDPNVLE